MSIKAVVLDRDGTIIRQKNFITSISEVKILARAPAALKELQSAGYRLIVFTNQSGVARGLITEPKLKIINQYVQEHFKKKGVRLERIYYCPHHPEGEVSRYRKVCPCRKPAPGMLRQAKRDFGINWKRSFVIGDSMRDVSAGRKAGATTILVLTGQGKKTQRYLTTRDKKDIDFIATDLPGAVKFILQYKEQEKD